MPINVASSIFISSESDEERTLTGTPSGTTAGLEGASDYEEASKFEGASGSEKAYGYEDVSPLHGPTIPAAPIHFSSSDEADNADFTPAPLTDVPAPVADQPNRWCVGGQYQVYRDAKPLNNKSIMTQILTVERRVLTTSLHSIRDPKALFTCHRL